MRVHQFHKVELVKFARPDQSMAELESLTADACAILEKLGLHRKQTGGLNIWTCEVTGPRKSRRLHGYLLTSPEALFQEVPPDNPYLGLANEAPRREDSALGSKIGNEQE